MKKIAVVALLLTVICLIPLLASAASCPKHPSAKVSTTVTGGYEQHSVVKHKRAAVDTCSVCGDVLQSRYVFDWHQYNGNTCVYCGYVKPAKDELNRDALLLGSDIVNRELWVLYQADIYSGVNGSRVTTARPEEQYYIEAYQNDYNSVWIQVRRTDSFNTIGWMKAENVAVSERPQQVNTNGLIGRSFRITVSSGRGRTGAGTEFAYVETVHYGEVYTILDVANASNGVAWFKLKVSGTECWVSSGLGSWN